MPYMQVYFVCICSLYCFCFAFMLFQVAEDEQLHPLTHLWQYHPPAIISSRPDGRLDIQPALLVSFNSLYTNCIWAYVCMDAKELWKSGRSFILAGFTISPWCTLTRETDCDPAPPAQLWPSLWEDSSLTASLVILFHVAFSLTAVCFVVSICRDNGRENRSVCFGVLADRWLFLKGDSVLSPYRQETAASTRRQKTGNFPVVINKMHHSNGWLRYCTTMKYLSVSR